jgi:hypothetical protein
MFATSFVLGYHGCDEKIGEKILDSDDHVSPSSNAYDWLGAGAYFWENSPRRALSWAKFLQKYPAVGTHKVETPFVIGAIIDLGNCLDLSDAGSLTIIRKGYEEFKATTESAGAKLPVNESAHDKDTDLVKRNLDCAVVNFVHALRDRSKLQPFDTVRGIFTEGGELFPGAKIQAKTHVQVCVRNPTRSIKGYFRPLIET